MNKGKWKKSEREMMESYGIGRRREGKKKERCVEERKCKIREEMRGKKVWKERNEV